MRCDACDRRLTPADPERGICAGCRLDLDAAYAAALTAARARLLATLSARRQNLEDLCTR